MGSDEAVTASNTLRFEPAKPPKSHFEHIKKRFKPVKPLQTVKDLTENVELDSESRTGENEGGQVQEFERKITLQNSIEPSVETSSKHEMSVEVENLQNIENKILKNNEQGVNNDIESENVKDQNNYKTCFGLLHEGGWSEMVPDFEPEANSTFQVSMAGNASLAWTGPGSCEYKIYDPPTLKSCLSKNYPTVQIVGDSRARQYWAAIKPLVADEVEEHFIMFDSAWQMPTENKLEVNSTGLVIDQAWVKKYGALQKSMRMRYSTRSKALGFQPDAHRAPNLVIMTAMILHPVTMSGLERDPTWNDTLTNTTYMLDEATRAGEQMRTQVIEELKLWSKYATVLVIEAEPISPVVYPLDAQRNVHVAAHNKLLKEVIPETGLDGKIFRISANLKVVQHPNGKFMLPDRFHLQKKDKPRVTPPTLLTNINIMANFLCNRYQENASQGNLCCKRELERYV
jgi:hypothetical protein